MVEVPVLKDLRVGLTSKVSISVVGEVVHAISSVAFLLSKVKVGDLQS